MLRGIRLRLGFWISILLAVAVALAGAVGLGRLYLRIVRGSSGPPGTRVTAGAARSVTAGDKTEPIQLNPIPVYVIQAGVYSTARSAEEAAELIRAQGYAPYITQAAPYRLWIGVYRHREDAEATKQALKDKGIGSFTAAHVVNGSYLKSDGSNGSFIRETAPLLAGYGGWLKENLPIFTAYRVEGLNRPLVDSQAAVATEVYRDLGILNKNTVCNDPEINRLFAVTWETVERYHEQLAVFLGQKNQANYEALQHRLLTFIDNYLLLSQKLDSISKT